MTPLLYRLSDHSLLILGLLNLLLGASLVVVALIYGDSLPWLGTQRGIAVVGLSFGVVGEVLLLSNPAGPLDKLYS
jgi:hypothetical protein